MSGGYYTAIEIVKDYGEYLEDCFCSCPFEYSLDQISYARWAISELLYELEYCLPGDELSTMENLSNKFDEYSRLNSRNRRMFSVAYEVVNNAMDLYFSY